jgi:hypothetical protein
MERPICKYPKLKGKIIEVFGSITDFSIQMNKTPTTIGSKLNGKSVWKLSEIDTACELLHISPAERHEFF